MCNFRFAVPAEVKGVTNTNANNKGDAFPEAMRPLDSA